MSSSARSSTSSTSSAGGRACPKIPLADIKAATHNFASANIIHEGEFGITYKGILEGQEVAVKRFDKDGNIVEQFRNEIQILSKFPSQYLVSLRGRCEESKEMIIVHESMRNGTLADHLHKEDATPLSWEQRVRICIGVARGLDYLHNGIAGSKRIIHRNVTSNNILIDENWSAKISEFGYAKNSANTVNGAAPAATMVRGTDGYLDPYYNLTGQLTRRTDIYSFGVVLFEVLSGRLAFNGRLGKDQQKLGEWAKKCYANGTLDQIVDKNLTGKIPRDSFKEFADVAYSCLDDNPINRPKMSDVIDKLESALKKA